MNKNAHLLIIIMLGGILSCTKPQDRPTNNPNSNSLDSSNYGNWKELINNNLYNFRVNTICSDNNNNIYIGGEIGVYPNYVVRKWDSLQNNWVNIGNGINSQISENSIWNLFSDNLNNLYANVGYYPNTGSTIYRHIKRWDGNNWTDIGKITSSNINNQIAPFALSSNINNFGQGLSKFTCDANNNIYFACYEGWNQDSTGIYKWNNRNWSKVGSSLPSGDFSYTGISAVPAIHVDENNNLLVSGAYNFRGPGVFDTISSYIAKFSNIAWDITSPKRDLHSINVKSSCYSKKYGLFYITKSSFSNKIIQNLKNGQWKNIEIGERYTVIDNGNNIGYSNICSDRNGDVYLAQILGSTTIISKFDGTNWYNISPPLNAIVDNIAVTNNGNIYVVTNQDYSPYTKSKVFLLNKK